MAGKKGDEARFYRNIADAFDAIAYDRYEAGSYEERWAAGWLSQRFGEYRAPNIILSESEGQVLDALAEAVEVPHQKGLRARKRVVFERQRRLTPIPVLTWSLTEMQRESHLFPLPKSLRSRAAPFRPYTYSSCSGSSIATAIGPTSIVPSCTYALSAAGALVRLGVLVCGQ